MGAAAAHEEREQRREGAVLPANGRRPPSRRPSNPRGSGTTTGVWWARLAHRGPGPVEHSLVAVNSDRFPDGTPVDLTAVDPRGQRPAGWQVDVRYRASDGRVVRVEVAETVAVPEQPLWFAELFHATSGIPAVSLLAFAGDAFPPGSVVTPHGVTARGLAMRDRVAELRWWTRSGLIDTVLLEPAGRGQGMRDVLVAVAGGLGRLRGWAPLRTAESS